MSSLAQDTKALFDTALGQRVLIGLAKKCGYFSRTFHRDPYTHAFNAGCAEPIKDILSLMHMSPTEFQELVRREHAAGDPDSRPDAVDPDSAYAP